ncbi:MAG: O-antigen polymerase [Candidatus Nanohaloarchaea archaeon]
MNEIILRKGDLYSLLLIVLGIIPISGSIIALGFKISLFRGIFSLLFLSLALVFFLISYSLYGDYFSPIGLMGGSWMVSISLSTLKLSPAFQTTWELDTWIALFISLISFLLGCYIVHSNLGFSSKNEINDEYYFPRLVFLIFIISFTSFLVILAFMILEAKITSHQQFSIAWYKQLQRQFWIFGVGYLYYLNFIIPTFVIGYTYKYRANYKLFVLAILSIITWPFNILALSHLILPIFSIFILLNSINNHSFTLKKLYGLIVVLVFIFVIGDLVYGTRVESFISTNKVKFPEELSFLAMPYLYASTAFDNIQVILDSDIDYRWGTISFEPILKFTLIQDLLDVDPNPPNLMYGSRFNASSYLSSAFYDFGWFGVLIMPFIYGSISMYLYKLNRDWGSIPTMVSYSIIAFPVTFAFFGNFFNSVYIWVFIFLCLILHLRYDRSYIST